MPYFEEIPTIDLSTLDKYNLENFMYIISEVCEKMIKENAIFIKIIKKDNMLKNEK